MSLEAVVFDFDGTIVDSEAAGYRAWQEEYARHGAELPLEVFQATVGTVGGDDDPALELARLVGDAYDLEAGTARRRARWRELTREAAVRDGVLDLLDELSAAGVRTAVASSSRQPWLREHLSAAGLLDRFDAVVGRDDVGGRAKPHPDVYVEALRRLAVRPDRAVALEDSTHGVAAARAAGLAVVAVPNVVTASTDLSAASLRVDTLVGVGLDRLAALLPGTA